MKQLAAIAVSALLYYRKAFPEEAFMHIPYDNTRVPLLHPILWRGNKFVFRVVEALLKFFRDFEKNSRYEFVLVISKESTSEMHKLSFSMKGKKIVMTFVM
jgi:hypothetical protein